MTSKCSDRSEADPACHHQHTKAFVFAFSANKANNFAVQLSKMPIAAAHTDISKHVATVSIVAMTVSRSLAFSMWQSMQLSQKGSNTQQDY